MRKVLPVDNPASVQRLPALPVQAQESSPGGRDWLAVDSQTSWFSCQYGDDVLFHLIGGERLANIAAGATGQSLHHMSFTALGRDPDHGHAFRVIHCGQL